MDKNIKTNFIIAHNVGKDIIWYTSEVYYQDETCPENYWVLGMVCSQQKEKALRFTNKNKAEQVAKILSDQEDEYGYKAKFYVKEEKLKLKS